MKTEDAEARYCAFDLMAPCRASACMAWVCDKEAVRLSTERIDADETRAITKDELRADAEELLAEGYRERAPTSRAWGIALNYEREKPDSGHCGRLEKRECNCK